MSVKVEFPQGGGGFVARDLRVELEAVDRPIQAASDLDAAALKHKLQILQQRLALLERDIEGPSNFPKWLFFPSVRPGRGAFCLILEVP